MAVAALLAEKRNHREATFAGWLLLLGFGPILVLLLLDRDHRGGLPQSGYVMSQADGVGHDASSSTCAPCSQ